MTLPPKMMALSLYLTVEAEVLPAGAFMASSRHIETSHDFVQVKVMNHHKKPNHHMVSNESP